MRDSLAADSLIIIHALSGHPYVHTSASNIQHLLYTVLLCRHMNQQQLTSGLPQANAGQDDVAKAKTP